MATKIEMESQRDAEAQLQFQEFTPSSAGVAELDVKTFPNDHIISPELGSQSDMESKESKVLYLDGSQKGASGPSFWTFEYYQQFFDVDTKQVIDRIMWSMIPKPGSNYLQNYIKPNPDLYGPFWICVTLVFTIAISGNLANYLQTAASSNYHWKYEFHTVTYAATAIFLYAWILPLALWGVIWWCGNQSRLSFLEIVCVYGYSLFIYIPVSVLWVIQVGWLQWLLVVIGAVLSGSVLLMTIWPAVENNHRRVSCAIVITMLALHILLAAGFMLYFFHVPPLEEVKTTAG
ncbi:protein YIPF1 [Ischnura elegans]|uniref:protein YIPF1 n=1 Tax=Ischnura elegans TaxID=197161 RepID=UPI001ED884F4|nr:protein YIPF1 [Ischnura elegans]